MKLNDIKIYKKGTTYIIYNGNHEVARCKNIKEVNKAVYKVLRG